MLELAALGPLLSLVSEVVRPSQSLGRVVLTVQVVLVKNDALVVVAATRRGRRGGRCLCGRLRRGRDNHRLGLQSGSRRRRWRRRSSLGLGLLGSGGSGRGRRGSSRGLRLGLGLGVLNKGRGSGLGSNRDGDDVVDPGGLDGTLLKGSSGGQHGAGRNEGKRRLHSDKMLGETLDIAKV